MPRLLDFLSQTKIIIISLLATLGLGAAFAAVPPMIGGDLLDMFWTADTAQTRITAMTEQQKSTHIWVTIILDSLYPLAYGGLLAGIAARFTSTWRKFAVLPALVTICADFLENAVQVFALAGVDNILFLKTVITPIKYSGLIVAVSIALMLLVRALLRRSRNRS